MLAHKFYSCKLAHSRCATGGETGRHLEGLRLCCLVEDCIKTKLISEPTSAHCHLLPDARKPCLFAKDVCAQLVCPASVPGRDCLQWTLL